MAACFRAIAFIASLSCASAMASEFDPWAQKARYELEYRVDLRAYASAEAGTTRVWIPLPADNEQQRVRSEEIRSPWPVRETRDGNGNRIVYLEPGGQKIDAHEVALRFVIERAPYAGVPAAQATSGTPLDPERYLGPQRRIPLEGRIGKLAEETTRDCRTDGERIRAIYDYVVRRMRYSKQGEGWGRGDALWACDSQYGNCTDFHAVIIGLARSREIPARFVIGFPIPSGGPEATISGYHCWAELYDRERGWVPVDASEAWKAKRFDDYFGKLPSDRVEFTVGRDLVLEPPQKGAPLNFFIYPYAEIQGEPADQVPWQVTVRRRSASEPGD